MEILALYGRFVWRLVARRGLGEFLQAVEYKGIHCVDRGVGFVAILGL